MTYFSYVHLFKCYAREKEREREREKERERERDERQIEREGEGDRLRGRPTTQNTVTRTHACTNNVTHAHTNARTARDRAENSYAVETI